MIQYLLEGWQREIDATLRLEWQKLVDAGTRYRREDVRRTLNYHMHVFAHERYASRNWMEQFRPFANAYIEQQIDGRLRAFEIYKGIDEVIT